MTFLPRDRTPVDDFGWGEIRWLVNGDIVPGTDLTVGHVAIEPGKKNPLHSHDCEEVLHLYDGELDHRIGDDVISMRAGDTIRVPPDVRHDAQNTGTTMARMVIVYSSPQRGYTALE